MAWIAIDNNLSLGTLYQIKKKLETSINKRLMKGPINCKKLINSSYFQSIIYNYLSTSKISWNSNDICAYIRNNIGLVIPKRIIRRILKEKLSMSYKIEQARLMNFNKELQNHIKQWFSIWLWKVINIFFNINKFWWVLFLETYRK